MKTLALAAALAALPTLVQAAEKEKPAHMERGDAFELKSSLLEEAARRRQLDDLLAPLLKRRQELLSKYDVDPAKDRVDLEKDVGKIDRAKPEPKKDALKVPTPKK